MFFRIDKKRQFIDRTPHCNREKGKYEWDGKWEQHYENGQLMSKGLIQWVKQKHLLKLLSQALEEKTMALGLCMEYLSPTSKDNLVSFALPQINNALDASQAAGSILTAVKEGSLTPLRQHF